jgi:type IV pilus assembly protein PilQ
MMASHRVNGLMPFNRFYAKNSSSLLAVARLFPVFKFYSALAVLILSFVSCSYGQQDAGQPAVSEEQAAVEEASPASQSEAQTAVVEMSASSQNVTLDFKDADIRNVLKIISYKCGINIVATPDVMGNVTIRLVDVPWEKALDVILRTYGFGYERIANIITVAPIDKLTEQKKQETELAQVQPTVTEVFDLQYLDAMDAKKALDPLISSRGRITVLEMTGQAGWEFGGTELSKRQRRAEETMGRSKTLIVSDVPPVLDKIKEVIVKIDVKPQQIAIETRIVEVNHDYLTDIGFDFGTGSGGATGAAITGVPVDKTNDDGTPISTLGGKAITSQVASAIFNPKQSAISGKYPYSTGLELLFQKLSGNQFEVLIHALEENVHTNTLSAPRIITLNNQEASILVGTKYPILKSEESTQSEYTVSRSLDRYLDIGIQLNVVPQISGKDYINMIIHPAVTASSTGVGSTASVYYPIITTREAETRVIIKSGETVVIGGLLKDVKSTSTIGIPLLKDIPFLGRLFRKDTEDTEKIDLLVFITAHIVKDDEFSPEAIANLTANLGKDQSDK